ncbi:inner membrane protein [Comamonas sp. BIGb0124]|uniref:metal-dependent hydrolase n=1 Tax=Comamonas sp. BIGb0124 TaxID=2485130 RepID=UPI000F4ACDA5|nr:metal-dependent hydrolase [Comamonas sp. BIGb0124]ROR24778.1 inner membrane protein [Comamonas sp. BIGb0124]
MDSLTQVVLGSTVAALAVPAKHRRAALVVGAVLGTVPDLDVLWFGLAGSDAVTTVTWHRGPSHALLVLAALGWLLWLAGRRWTARVREAPGPWLTAIWLSLLTHPLLDAFTVYGTQLFWPLSSPPVMASTVFVIDPLYTLPLLCGTVAAWVMSGKNRNVQAAGIQVANHRAPSGLGRATDKARRWLLAGLILSSCYLGWSVWAKYQVDRAAERALSGMGLADVPRFSVPMPLNTLLWRVIAMAPEGGYYVADRSLVADRGEMAFAFQPSDTAALAQVAEQSAGVRRLLWFTQGFVNARTEGVEGQPRLILSDLRMGVEPDYNFRYDVAGQDAQGRWVAAEPIIRSPGADGRAATLGWVWRRIWDSQARP